MELILGIAIGLAAGVVAGVLIGRKNKKGVEKLLNDAKEEIAKLKAKIS